jgi:hypothetical protein
MTVLPPVSITGIGFWSPRLPGWELARDVACGRAVAPDLAQARVAPALLAPTERRRAPDTVALALEVASRACEAAKVDPKLIPSVFASTYGDLPINDYMCSTLATTPLLCSPTKFHNSVHNAAAGYWTIGTGSVRPSTALLAGDATFAAGLLEAASQALADATPVLFVAYDVAPRGPLAEMVPSEGMLAMALVIDPAAVAGHATLSLSVDSGTPDAVAVPAAWQSALPANAMNRTLPLFAALATGRGGSFAWPLGTGCRLAAMLDPATAEAA